MTAGKIISRDPLQPPSSPYQQLGNKCTVDGTDFSIITPVSRYRYKQDLMRLAVSIRWDCVNNWILVYDTSRQHDLQPMFSDSPQVTEIYFQAEAGAVLGNMQRNRVLQNVMQGLVYFLDDDNIMHPSFWDILPNVSLGHITTFDQLRLEFDPPERWPGDRLAINAIDTGMFVIDRSLIGQTQWNPNAGNADGMFIEAVSHLHPNKHIYISEVAAYHHGLV